MDENRYSAMQKLRRKAAVEENLTVSGLELQVLRPTIPAGKISSRNG
jgi:hypothetical protein